MIKSRRDVVVMFKFAMPSETKASESRRRQFQTASIILFSTQRALSVLRKTIICSASTISIRSRCNEGCSCDFDGSMLSNFVRFYGAILWCDSIHYRCWGGGCRRANKLHHRGYQPASDVLDNKLCRG